MTITEAIKFGSLGIKPKDIKRFNEAGIDSESVIALAKNGYSVADVDELITLTQESAEIVQPNTKTCEGVPEAPVGTGEETRDNYKEEIESKDARIKDLEDQVKAIQNMNAYKNLGQPETKTPRQQIQEAFSTLY